MTTEKPSRPQCSFLLDSNTRCSAPTIMETGLCAGHLREYDKAPTTRKARVRNVDFYGDGGGEDVIAVYWSLSNGERARVHEKREYKAGLILAAPDYARIVRFIANRMEAGVDIIYLSALMDDSDETLAEAIKAAIKKEEGK